MTRYEGNVMMVFNYSEVLWEETEETRVKQKCEASCAQQRVV